MSRGRCFCGSIGGAFPTVAMPRATATTTPRGARALVVPERARARAWRAGRTRLRWKEAMVCWLWLSALVVCDVWCLVCNRVDFTVGILLIWYGIAHPVYFVCSEHTLSLCVCGLLLIIKGLIGLVGIPMATRLSKVPPTLLSKEQLAVQHVNLLLVDDVRSKKIINGGRGH